MAADALVVTNSNTGTVDNSLNDEFLRTVFPITSLTNSDEGANLSRWYLAWFKRQIDALPSLVTDRCPDIGELLIPVAFFFKAGKSLDDVAEFVLGHFTDEQDDASRDLAKTISFAILGWQTMLYLPSVNTCPLGNFAVADVFDGHTIPAFWAIRQDSSLTHLPIPDFLLGFGLMLPQGNVFISEDTEDCQNFDRMTMVRPEEFNIALMVKYGGVRVSWTDVLPAHMEFDPDARVLFLYKYPTFCYLNLPESSDSIGVIHSCSSVTLEKWGSIEDVTQYLREILLSYRLIFGQSHESRKLFRTANPFGEKTPNELRDPLLEKLCTTEHDNAEEHKRVEVERVAEYLELRSGSGSFLVYILGGAGDWHAVIDHGGWAVRPASSAVRRVGASALEFIEYIGWRILFLAILIT
ncbi:uncharacterized protein DFL_006759 [Arthrobotrys flagrans]|uniref:Uncharacterized protein n=1 Tax=Arthrobotrys flagrans TaxID=97331 RepID=A0A436ZTP7_ARTFL|nr:hypothetical protein DFL_006759 [Arthrobotrys flagrans]